MKKSKLLCLALSSILAVASLAGCGNNNDITNVKVDTGNITTGDTDTGDIDAGEIEKDGTVYLTINRNDVFMVGFSTEKEGGGMSNADGGALPRGDRAIICDDLCDRAKEAGGKIEYTVTAYNEADEVIAEKTFLYTVGDGVIELTLYEDGLIDGGHEVDTLVYEDVVTASLLDDAAFGERAETAVVLGNPDLEYSAKILLETDAKLKDFKFWSLSSDIDSDGNLSIEEENIIGSAEYLDADNSVIVCGDFGEFVPVKGISFIDEDGMTQFYSMILSGEDGSPVLEHYKTEVLNLENASNPDYAPIISKYQKIVRENWSAEKIIAENDDLSHMIAVALQDDPRATVGYWLTDVNGDDTLELIIGANSESVFYGSMIFAMYGIDQNGTKLLLESSERDTFYWCGDNRIDNKYARSADECGRHIISYDGMDFKIIEGVEYNAKSTSGMWMKVKGSQKTSISEAEADKLSYDYDYSRVQIPLKNF